MGTKLKRHGFTRKEKIEESRGKTPKRLKDFLNNMTIKTEGRASDSLSGQIGLIINGYAENTA